MERFRISLVMVSPYDATMDVDDAVDLELSELRRHAQMVADSIADSLSTDSTPVTGVVVGFEEEY